MRITIFGSGYVGLVSGACLADAGNTVVCVDVDGRKIDMLKRGEIPIHEPGLDAVIKRNFDAGRLSFTTDAKAGVDHGQFQIIAVGTPPDEDGSADLRYVLAVAGTIGEHMTEYKVVITKSTVPVGTADKVRDAVAKALKARQASLEYDTVSNPEFLKEGAAINDFMKPDRVVIGTDSTRAADLMRTLYEPFTRNRDRMIVMDVRSADEVGYQASILTAVEEVNNRQKLVLFNKIKAFFGDLKGKTIALWGLAFKPHTDDMREAASRVLMEALWTAGAKVRAYDPVAMPECRRIYGDRHDLVLCKTSPEAVQGADALAIVTEWQEFRSPDFDYIKSALRTSVIFDGRNLYDPAHMARAGFGYHAVGRGKPLQVNKS